MVWCLLNPLLKASMTYYLVYLYKNKVVDVGSFDNEEAQMKQFFYASNLEDWKQHVRYDSVQPFSVIS